MTKNEIVGRLRDGGLDASSTNRRAAVYVADAMSGRVVPGWFAFMIVCNSEDTERRARAILSRLYDIDVNGNLWRLRSKNRVPLMAIKRGGVPPTPPAVEYMYFEAVQANSTVSMLSSLATAPNLEYSTDGETWQEWQHTTTTEDEMTMHTFDTLTLTAVGDKVYLRGDNPNGFLSILSEEVSFFSLTGKIESGGNAQSLVDGDSPTLLAKSMPLFSAYMLTEQADTTLLSAPDFPATSLQDWCYTAILAMCTDLEQPAVFGAIINKDSSAAVKQTGTAFASIYAGTEFDITDDNGVTLKGFEGIGPFPIVCSLGDFLPDPVNRLGFCKAIGNINGFTTATYRFTTNYTYSIQSQSVESNHFADEIEVFNDGLQIDRADSTINEYPYWVPTDGYTDLAITPNIPSGYHIQKWQKSTDGETWTDVPGSSGATLTIRIDTATDYYYKLILEQD